MHAWGKITWPNDLSDAPVSMDSRGHPIREIHSFRVVGASVGTHNAEESCWIDDEDVFRQ
jgi:hypothetical protein